MAQSAHSSCLDSANITAHTSAGQTAEFYTYLGHNHYISNSLGTAMTRTIELFDRYLKGE